MVMIGWIFDRDARRSGPTNYFVGFQGFTQKSTRITRKLENFLADTNDK